MKTFQITKSLFDVGTYLYSSTETDYNLSNLKRNEVEMSVRDLLDKNPRVLTMSFGDLTKTILFREGTLSTYIPSTRYNDRREINEEEIEDEIEKMIEKFLLLGELPRLKRRGFFFQRPTIVNLQKRRFGKLLPYLRFSIIFSKRQVSNINCSV